MYSQRRGPNSRGNRMPKGRYLRRKYVRAIGASKELRRAIVQAVLDDDFEKYGVVAKALREWLAKKPKGER